MIISDINTASPPLSVVRIEVERLFGRYTYTLSKEDQHRQLDSSLVILYGDNGSGKTTILKLLFHLLSPAQNRGHRTFLAQTPFAKFSVLLADGTQIVCTRGQGKLTGSFQVKILRGEEIVPPVNYEVDDNRKVKSEDDKFIRTLNNLQLSQFFLGDDRVLNSDIFETEESGKEQILKKFLFSQISRGIDVQPTIDR